MLTVSTAGGCKRDPRRGGLLRSLVYLPFVVGLAAAPATLALPAAVGLPLSLTATDLPNLNLARLVLGDPGLDRAEAACLQRPLASVDFEGCRDGPCAAGGVQDQMVSLTDLRVGRPVQAGQLRLAWERLLRIGYFKSVAVTCKADAGGRAEVRWQVTGNQFVRAIEFAGNNTIFQDELRAKMLIQPGDILNLGTTDGNQRIQAQQEALEGVYRRLGFDEARAELQIEELTPGQLRVVVRIDEGNRKRITQTRILVQDLPEPTPLERRHGLICPRLGERALRDAADTSAMVVFSQREANRVRARVRAHLRQQGYGNPRVDVLHDPAEQAVRIEVKPGRCALVQVLVRDDAGGGGSGGFVLTDDRSLYQSLPFGESGLFDFDEAQRGRSDLLGVLENRGYLYADVRLDYRPVPMALSQQVTAAIKYYVTSGYVSQVRGIFFHAVDHPKQAAKADDQLRPVLTTKAYDVLDAGGYLQVDQLLADLEALRQHYLSDGYYQFHYAVTLPQGVTPTAANHRVRTDTANETVYTYRYADKGFRVRRPLGENFIYIDIDLVEGERARLRSLTVEGASQVRASELQALMVLRQGQIISHALVEKSLRAVEERYRNNGYFRSKIEMWCASSQPDRAWAPCTAASVLARDVDVQLRIEEGERVDFGESFVVGNFVTDPAVLLRDMPAAGSPYSAAAVFETQRRLRNLGLFSQVSLATLGDQEKPPRDRLASVLSVVEGQNRFWEASLGFQTINTARSAYEQETIQGLKDFIDRSTTAADRVSNGYGRTQNLTLPNLLATAEAAYVNRNFLRTGKFLKLSMKLGATFPPDYSGVPFGASPRCPIAVEGVAAAPCADWYDAKSRTPPWYSDILRYAAVLPTYQDGRLFGSEVGLRVIAPYLLHDYAIGPIDIDKSGALVELTRRFGKLAASMAMDAGVIRTRAPEARDRDFSGSLQPQISVVPSVTWDNTDSPLNPRQGFSLNFSLPYINAQVRTLDFNRGGRVSYEQANFLKWEVSARYYQPIGESVVLATTIHGGAGRTLSGSGTQLPLFARFRLGGQYTQTLLRGYTDFGIRQYDANGCTRRLGADGRPKPCDAPILSTDTVVADADVVLNGSAELRFPIAAQQGIWGAGFWDFGGISESWDALHPASFRHGLGIGVRYLVSGQIPARIDYAIAVGQRCRDITTAANGAATCTVDDFGQLRVGLLYAF